MNGLKDVPSAIKTFDSSVQDKQVNTVVTRLGGAVDEQKRVLNLLEQRLEPVLNTDTAKGGGGGGGESEAMCPLAEHLGNLAYQFESHTERITAILHQLEL